MKWLVINTEAFSPRGLDKKLIVGKNAKGKSTKRHVMFADLPWIVQKFISAYPNTFAICDESSKLKTNTPMNENDKSMRTRLIKLVGKYAAHTCIMTGTLMSKSPLNVVDQYNFLKENYFPESMWELAERYCVMITIRVGRGRRVLINQKDYATIRTRLKNAFIRGGETQLEAAKESVFKQYAIDYTKQEHIIRHRKYTPFINEKELLRRIAPDTLFVRREDVFDIQYDKFVKEPIMRPVELSKDAKQIANELIKLGFTDRLVLGKTPALELLTRLQDVCNGFEPVKDEEGKVSYCQLLENPKLDELINLMEEIDAGKNQMVVWASRRNILDICADRFEKEGYTFVRYDGSASNTEKEAAEQAFIKREASIFLATQSSGAYGLNCLAQCSYAVYMCVDGSVEKYHQSQHRILRGQLTAPKFSYAIYAAGTVEERQWTALKVGQELIESDNRKEKFIFV
jgi:SNF2 family DNA or RNA helicase